MLDGTIAADDVTRLWRNISKTMKLGLGTIYMRMGNVNQELLRLITVDGQTSSESVEQMQTMKRLAQNLELPFYAKFLLIAEEAPPVGQRKGKGVGEDGHPAGTEGVHHRPAVGHLLRHPGREGRPDVQLAGANLNADSSQVPELCLRRGNHHGRQRATSVHRMNGLYRAYRQDGRLQRETVPV